MSESQQAALPDSPKLAQAKRIGWDIEDLVVAAVDDLRHADDPDAHHDAVTESVLDPRTLDAPVPVTWGTPLVLADALVEVKAAVLERSNGDRTTPGQWAFKGRDDGQHRALLAASGYYALAVYTEDAGDRSLAALAFVPATVVDGRLAGSWYGIDRHEGTRANLAWPHIFGDDLEGVA